MRFVLKWIFKDNISKYGMDDDALRKICLLLAVAGIGGLAVAGLLAEPVAVSGVNEEDIGKIVRMTGEASKVSHAPSVTFIEINGVKIVRFAATPVKDGDIVEVTGRVSLYRGDVEIVAESIRGVED